MTYTDRCPALPPDLDATEARIREEFPPGRWYDLLVRVAARTDLERVAVERVADEVLAHERRIRRLEDASEAAE